MVVLVFMMVCSSGDGGGGGRTSWCSPSCSSRRRERGQVQTPAVMAISSPSFYCMDIAT